MLEIESTCASKKMKIDAATKTVNDEDKKRLLCRFKSESGEVVGDLMDLPLNCSIEQLTLICNALLQQVIIIIFDVVLCYKSNIL